MAKYNDYEIGPLLRQAQRKAADAFGVALRPLDVQGRHFGVLLALHREGPLSQRQLVDGLGSDKSSMVRTVDDLEALDACVRNPVEGDRRAYAVHLTPTGEELYEEALEIARSTGRQLLSGFTSSERVQFQALLTRFVQGT